MGARDLPDMYARGLRAFISGESQAPMLQVTCITSRTLPIYITMSSHFDYGIFTWRFHDVYLYNAL